MVFSKSVVFWFYCPFTLHAIIHHYTEFPERKLIEYFLRTFFYIISYHDWTRDGNYSFKTVSILYGKCSECSLIFQFASFYFYWYLVLCLFLMSFVVQIQSINIYSFKLDNCLFWILWNTLHDQHFGRCCCWFFYDCGHKPSDKSDELFAGVVVWHAAKLIMQHQMPTVKMILSIVFTIFLVVVFKFDFSNYKKNFYFLWIAITQSFKYFFSRYW